MKNSISEIRARLIEQRKGLSLEYVKEKSLEMRDDILNSENYKKCKYLYIYSPINNEIDTNYLIVKALQDEKVVCLPVILSSGDMVFCQVNKTTNFRVDRFNILEPTLDPKTIVDQPGLMIVPLVGFKGTRRIGYGKQYYNNYLCNRKEYIYTIGVAYEFQKEDDLTFTDKDIPLNEIRVY
jgi:5-formyltetrahydrofolate cyclo-ligase